MCVHKSVGAWLSLVEHSVRDRGVGGSNPLAPTNFLIFLRESQNLAWRVTRFLLRLSVLGTEWPVRQIQPAVGIIRDFSPPSVAILPFQALVEAKRYLCP